MQTRHYFVTSIYSKMRATATCIWMLLGLLVRGTETRSMNETIAELIPEHIRKTVICLVNTNMTFEFPISRFYGRPGHLWRNPGKARVMPNLYIIELSHLDLESVFFDLHSSMVFEPKATHLLLTEEVNSKPLLNALMKFFIVEAFAVTPKGKIYRFDRRMARMRPIRRRDVVIQDLPIARLTDTTNVTLKVVYMKKPPFVICPDCPTEKGIEMEVFYLASKAMDLKVEYAQFGSSYWGEKLGTGYTFMYKEIFDRKFDVGFGQTFDFDDCHYDFDLTPIHVIDAMQFVVPKARRLKQFNIFNYIFERDTLLIDLMVLVLVFLMVCILNRWKNKLNKLMELIQIIFDVAFHIQRIDQSAMRWLYAFLLFAIGVLNTGLKSKLFWTLTMDHFEYQINSLDDIVHSNLIPVFNNRTEGYFDKDDPIDKFMDDNSPKTCGFELECVDMVAFYRNITTMKLKKTLEYYTPRQYVDKKGKALIHIIDEDIQKVYLRFFFIKGHPVFPRFSRVIAALIENGINEYISDKLLEGNRKAQAQAEMKAHVLTVQKLNMMQLLNVVYIYIGGIILSFLVFCAELLFR